MKLGFVSAILPDLSLQEVIEFAAAEGFECVELMCWPVGRADRRYAGVTHVDVTDFDRSQANGVLEVVEGAGMEISSLGYYPNLLAPDRGMAEMAEQHLRTVICAAELLGLERVTTFVGRDASQSVDANWPRFLEVWRPLVAFAEDHGVHIAIENCPMLFTADEWPGGNNLACCPAIWRRMFDDIRSPYFGLNFDPSHLVWQQIDYIAPLREFADRIFHVHAKDVRVDHERLNDVGILATPLEYHAPKLPGLGDVDWGRFFSVLTDIGYSGPVCVEVEDRPFEQSLQHRFAALRQSAAFLRNYVTRIQQQGTAGV
jgi:sugar phosphate isomerase/epimerase